MNCELAWQEFSSLRDNTVAPSLRVAIENHLKDCPDCRSAYEEFLSTWKALDDLGPIEPPTGLHDMIMSRVDAYNWARKRVRPGLWQTWLQRGLAVGAVASIAGFLWLATHRPNTNAVGAAFVPGTSPTLGTPMPSMTYPMPRLDMQSGTAVIRLSAARPVDYRAFVTDGARFDTADVLAQWSGRVPANGALDMPLLTLRPEGEATVWLVYGQPRTEQLAIVYIPAHDQQTRPVLTAFRGDLTEFLRLVASAREVPISFNIVSMSQDRPVVVGGQDAALPTRELLARVLDGTQFELEPSGDKDTVIRISPQRR